MSIPIDEQYEKPLLDQVASLKLHNNLLSIREAVAGLWADGPLVRDYTDHGPEHSIRLMKYISKLLACNQGKSLSQEELYVLTASIYLHDIGMQADVGKYPDFIARAEDLGAQFEVAFTAPSASQYSVSEQGTIRENHHWLSSAWIDHALDSDNDTAFNRAVHDIPHNAVDAIIDIITYHSKRDIVTCGDIFYYNGKQRKRLLAALLRFADEMDITSERVNIETVKEHRLPPASALWWWLHYCTELDLDDEGMFAIQVCVNRQDYEAYASKVKQLIVNHFTDKNDPLIDLLFKAGIHVHFDDMKSDAVSGRLEALPEEIKAEIDKRLVPSEGPWTWLRNHQPESYKQLVEKLKEASEPLSPSGRTELGQLARVFKWCGEHEVELAELQAPRHLHKYRDAAAYMNQIVGNDESDQSKIGKMREVIKRIKSDPDRNATRAWARESRTELAKGCQFTLEDGSAGLLILGPAGTIQKAREKVAKKAPWIEWNLSIENGLVEIQHAGQADDGG